MASLTDLSDLINRQTGGNNGTPENIFYHKVPRIAGAVAPATIAGRGCSLWTYDGYPAGGATPGAAAIPTLATQGAIPFTAAGGTREKWLISTGIVPQAPGVFLLYDRLFHIGNLSGTSALDQTVQGSPASPVLTRNVGGAGNFAFYEVYSQLGTSTITTITMTYTNQSGVGGRTSTAVQMGGTGFREVTRAQRLPLQSGDSGIQSIEKVKLSSSTGSASTFGIVIAQPLAWIPVGAAGIGGWRDYTTGLPGIPKIDNNSCLALFFIPSTTTAPEVFGAMSFVEK